MITSACAMHLREASCMSDDWYCRRCGEDLGDFAEVASGDCGACGRIVCENCWGHYDERTCEVTCKVCSRRAVGAVAR